MLADAGAPAVLAGSSGGYSSRCWRPPRRICWQMLAPPQSFHGRLVRVCSLQMLLSRLCWQMLAPPQSLHLLLGYAGRCWRPRSPCACSSGCYLALHAPPSAVRSPLPSSPPPFPTPACLPLLHRIVRLLPRRVAVSPLLAALAALALLLPVPAPAPLHQMGQARDRSSSAALPVRHRGRVHVVWIVRR